MSNSVPMVPEFKFDKIDTGTGLKNWLDNVYKFLIARRSSVSGTYTFSTASGKVGTMVVANGIITSITVTP